MIPEVMGTSRYSKVLRLLDEERKLLLSGPLDKLDALVKKREAAMAELLESDTRLPEAFIVALRARAERNGRLLQASIEGVKSAQAQVAKINEQSGELKTYTAEGRAISVSQKRSTRDTRA
jgi:flagellar biosynthesis/type III secretory pathway chaperone